MNFFYVSYIIGCIVFLSDINQGVIKVKKLIYAVLMLSLCLTVFIAGGCGSTQQPAEAYDIVATNFPAFDFARAVAGDELRITMLLEPGTEAHDFAPTLDDLAAIQNCSLFICTGGTTDYWAEEQFSSGNIDTSLFRTVSMMDCVTLQQVQESEEEHDHAHEAYAEYDEHVWTSPANAISIIESIRDALCAVYPEKEDIFRTNADAYITQITAQAIEMQAIVDAAENKLLVFENRFPFVYFCEYFGLSHLAAFGSCSSNTEVSASTLTEIINTIRDNNIPCILYLEFSRTETADQVVAATGCEKRELHSYHNVTREDLDNGITYIDLMKRNTETLKEALF